MSARKSRALLALYDAVVALRRDLGSHSIMRDDVNLRMEYATGCALLDSFGIVIEAAL